MCKYGVLILASFFLSCSSEKECGCGDYRMRVTLGLNDINGANLLNTQNYNVSNIYTYYLKNDVTYYTDVPNFISNASPSKLNITLSTDIEEAFPITYLRWNQNDTDTLKAHFIRGENTIVIDQLWINGVAIPNFEEDLILIK